MICQRQAQGGCSVTSFSLPGSSRLFDLLAALSLSMGLSYGGLHRWLLRGAAFGLALMRCKSCRRVAFTCGLLCTSHETQWLPPNIVRKIALLSHLASRFYIGPNHAARLFHQSTSGGVACQNMHVRLITFSHRESMEGDYGSSHSSPLPFSFHRTRCSYIR